MSEKTSAHVQLMREMRSPNGAFDPMPPSQIAFLMDISQPPEIRALGYVSWKTIHPTRTGKSFRRSAFMRDERGALGIKHCADYFDWPLSFGSVVFSKLFEQKRIFRDEKGRIYLNGDLPEPRLKEGGEEKAEKFCTHNLPRDIYLYLQSLPFSERAIVERDVNSIEEWGKRADAQALALSRAAKAELLDRYFEARGFSRPKANGRPRVERENLAVQLAVTAFPELSVHISSNGSNGHSVQNGNSNSYTTENGSEQIPPSLLTSEKSEIVRVSASPDAAQTAKPDEITHPPVPEEPEAEELIVSYLVQVFDKPFSPADKPVQEIAAAVRAANCPLPTAFVFLNEKRAEKSRYRVTAGLLATFAREDLRHWMREKRIAPVSPPPNVPAAYAAAVDLDELRKQAADDTSPAIRDLARALLQKLDSVKSKGAAS